MSAPVDWGALMRAGLGALRLPPETFWTMTPVEFRRALEGAGLAAAVAPPLRRSELERLIERFPDRSPTDR
ncbi:MAG: rcc01693 family protein [Paracoccaceae bacterium]